MKKNIIVSALFLITAFTASAQKEKGQFNVHVSYTPSVLVNCERYEYEGLHSVEMLQNTMMNGFNLGVGYAWNIWKKLFIETGGDLDFNFGSKKMDEDTKFNYNFIDVRVPVTVFYELEATKGFSVVPLAGLDLGCGLLGEQLQIDNIGDVETKTKTNYYGNSMGDYKYSRFIFDWHVGCKLKFADKYCIGYTFMSPITNMQYHKEKTSSSTEITKAYRQNHFITLSFIF